MSYLSSEVKDMFSNGLQIRSSPQSLVSCISKKDSSSEPSESLADDRSKVGESSEKVCSNVELILRRDV